jgi:hypothetical protein
MYHLAGILVLVKLNPNMGGRDRSKRPMGRIVLAAMRMPVSGDLGGRSFHIPHIPHAQLASLSPSFPFLDMRCLCGNSSLLRVSLLDQLGDPEGDQTDTDDEDDS